MVGFQNAIIHYSLFIIPHSSIDIKVLLIIDYLLFIIHTYIVQHSPYTNN